MLEKQGSRGHSPPQQTARGKRATGLGAGCYEPHGERTRTRGAVSCARAPRVGPARPWRPPREPRSQLRFPRPFVPTTPPDQCCRYWFAHYCSCRVHCCFLAGFIGAVLDPLCRFRGEAACLHPIQRKTVGKVAGNRGEWGSGVLEWWSPTIRSAAQDGCWGDRKEVKEEHEKNGELKPASDPIRPPASWSAVGEG